MWGPMADKRDEQSDWLPHRTLTVGVTGHRPERLGATDLTALHEAVAYVLRAIEAATGPAPVKIRLVSALAEGADSITADEALTRSWTLDVVLPFFRADYATDFDIGDAQDAHVRRLARAHSVFELPGHRDLEDAAYERAGRVVLAQSDILVAIWDNEPVRGRGGAAQIVAEAVLHGIAVIQIDPAKMDTPLLLWDGLEEADLGQQTVETVARGDLRGLANLVGGLLDAPDVGGEKAMLARFLSTPETRWAAGLAYPLLLAAMGIRRVRWADIRAHGPQHGITALFEICSNGGAFAERLRGMLAPRFARADAAATRVAQLFRSGYVTNFALAAFAVVLSLMGLALPPAAKPVLITLELGAIAIILLLTRTGNRAGWHRRWLDNRALAERLRCLAVSAQLGDLDLRGAGEGTPAWVGWYTRATARQLGLPSGQVNPSYLECVRADLMHLIDGQIAYLETDAHRMHRLEHRLHLLGTTLFGATALACLALLVFKTTYQWMPTLEWLQHPIATGATIASAALPAIGAAIYGIRMQGDFAGIASRNEALAHHLAMLRTIINDDALDFDTLNRRIRRATDLLTGDLESWLQTYHARPLALPG
jgi:hypothetical protein